MFMPRQQTPNLPSGSKFNIYILSYVFMSTNVCFSFIFCGTHRKILGWEVFDASKGKVTFAIPPNSQLVAVQVKLEIVENYGHPSFTCIYRFRVHGTPM